MSFTPELIQLINLARIQAAKDLEVSNELLDIVDNLVELAKDNNNHASTNDEIKKNSQKIIEEALKLANQSKKMSMAVSKFVGVI